MEIKEKRKLESRQQSEDSRSERGLWVCEKDKQRQQTEIKNKNIQHIKALF